MLRTAVLLPLALAALLPAPALAASASLTDPDDASIADVLRLSYDNGANKVVMEMTYDAHRPQVENFYVKWGTAGEYYKLQRSAGTGTTLWFSNGSGESKRPCTGDKVTHNANTVVSTAGIPRSCMPKAPDKVKFQGVVTEGLFASDRTKTSPGVARG